MRVVNQSAHILIPESPMKHIERIGRICYKSGDKISDGTDKKFIKMLFDNNHHAMLEHYRFIMAVNPIIYEELSKVGPRHVEFSNYGRYVISCNARALLELHEKCRCIQFGYMKSAVKGIRDELISHIIREYNCYELFGWNRNELLPPLSTGVEFIDNSREAMSEEEWNIHGWFSACIVTDRGISHEIVRHREEVSYAQESTRYCNYGQDRFGKEITVIDQGFDPSSIECAIWRGMMVNCEYNYFRLIKCGATPQFARSVLPTCLKTEIVMTAPMYEWDHFFNLRLKGTTGAPHPMVKEVAGMVYDDMMEVFYESNKN